MGAQSVTGTGPGSSETPIRQLQQLSKVVTLDEKAQFSVVEQTHVTSSIKNFSLEEQETGRTYHDGRPIYQKTITADSFTVASSYGRIPHGITDSFDMIESFGYVAGTYDAYANYKDATNYYWFWSGSGAFSVTVTILYVKN